MNNMISKEKLTQKYIFLKYALIYILYHIEHAYMGHITQHELLQWLKHKLNLFKRLKSFHNIFESEEKRKYKLYIESKLKNDEINLKIEIEYNKRKEI